MKFLPSNTLAHYNAAPFTKLHDLSEYPTAVFGASTLAYRKDCGLVSPQGEALDFYTLNHCASVIRKQFRLNEPLPAWAQTIMADYTALTMAQGQRMLHYILCITTREMRHLESHAHPSAAFWATLKGDYGVPMATFIKHLCTGGESAAVKAYMTHPPNASIGAYIKALSYGFHQGDGWQGEQQGYGGPKWGRVADAAGVMLHGKTSLETLVDVGYTLAHNGGPIFNKTEVEIYSHQNSSMLFTILDAQRAGQIPNLILDTTNHMGVQKTAVAKEAISTMMLHLPEVTVQPAEWQGWVNWVLVDALRPDKTDGSGKYTAAKAAQLKAHGTVSKPVVAKPVVKILGGQKIKITGTFEVFPANGGKPAQTVPIFERVP